jgi:arginine N-succinyltransferase
MLVIRPIQYNDLKGLLALAGQSGLGMTSLPADRTLLEKKIEFSISSFKAQIEAQEQIKEEFYMLVLENPISNEIFGVSAIKSQVGFNEPFYSYEIKEAEHKSDKLHVNKKIKYLQVFTECNGPSLLGSLFVDQTYRGYKYGKVLSLSRFLLMAEQPQRFKDEVIAEMRGLIKGGISPFWDKVVRPFFDMDYERADYLSTQDKSFIGDLMPKYPIYIPLLDKEIADIIGKVHLQTEPALRFLLKEGFQECGHVDIFDAGPRIKAKVADIKTVRESISATVIEILKQNQLDELRERSQKYLICFCKPGEVLHFRACFNRMVLRSKEEVAISTDLAAALMLQRGDKVRYIPI